MADSVDNQCKTLDEIIESRRTVRNFSEEIPTRETVEQILKSGLQAPYAAQAVGESTVFRRFFVFENGTESMKTAEKLMRNKAEEGLNHFKGILKEQPMLKQRVENFMGRLQLFVDNGVIGVGTAPYFIVVAELRGIPPVEQESIAHCMENMWLKATELGLGFQLVSLTSQMSENQEFLNLLGIPLGPYEINGCAIGYPATEMSKVVRPDIKEVSQWID